LAEEAEEEAEAEEQEDEEEYKIRGLGAEEAIITEGLLVLAAGIFI
jgi:hypothetical protein